MAFLDLLTQTATIESSAESNVGGVPKKTWTVVHASVPARLKANGGGAQKQAENLERIVRGEYTLFLPTGYGITEAMRVVLEGVTYEIVFVAEVREMASIHHLELQLNRIT